MNQVDERTRSKKGLARVPPPSPPSFAMVEICKDVTETMTCKKDTQYDMRNDDQVNGGNNRIVCEIIKLDLKQSYSHHSGCGSPILGYPKRFRPFSLQGHKTKVLIYPIARMLARTPPGMIGKHPPGASIRPCKVYAGLASYLLNDAR